MTEQITSTMHEDRLRRVVNRLYVSQEFYEPFERYQPRNHLYDHARAVLPRMWRLVQESFWTHAIPLDASAPVQGWKIHVSATPRNAERILENVIQVCVQEGTAFKFASDYFILAMLNSKACARGSSGKFMTLYPKNETHFKHLIEKLYQALQGEEGPYVLSDKRYKDCKVLYYRYGGIRSIKRFDAGGDATPMILSPTFEEVPDQRNPEFYVPEWTADPFPSEEEDTSEGLKGGRYVITGVMGHSNTGGVYTALDQHTGKTVVIKEARPFTNINPSGNDAIGQLKKEHRLLKKLSGTGLAPEALDYFTEWEHDFLVQELVEGNSLRGYAAKKSKIIRTRIDPEQVKVWFEQLRKLSLGIVRCIHGLHQQGVVFGDLSPNNIMLLSEDSMEVKLIDFEGACESGVDAPVNLFTPGFASQKRKGQEGVSFEDDYFALGSTLLSLMMPLTVVTTIKPDAIRTFTDAVHEDFGIPRKYTDLIVNLTGGHDTYLTLEEVIRVLEDPELQVENRMQILQTPEKVQDVALEQAVEQILAYTRSVATFERKDRLFPNGPHSNNPLSIDHGALGVAYAMHTIEGTVPEKVLQWIKNHDLNPSYVPGLYVGLSGMAWALAELGDLQAAKRVMEHAELHPLLFRSMDLHSGAAGYGLANLQMFHKTGEDHYLQEARMVAEVLQETKHEVNGGYAWSKHSGVYSIGLSHGSSGIALFLLYLHATTGEKTYLEFGEKALAFDLSYAKETEEGTLGFPDNTRSLNTMYPYLKHGSAGVGTVLLRYHQVTGKREYRDLIDKIRGAVTHKYALFPSFFSGLAGLGNYLLDCQQFLKDDSYLPLAHRVAQGILLFGIQKDTGLAFPGDYLHRISTDYATGSAGIALFLHRLKSGQQNFNFLPDHLLESIPAGKNALVLG
ncbi:class III lanthionine synthetase LanKC [Deinococcus cellulosilyticus]|uniref:Serine/threonine protein kinase n=1 Tax=Deinococcus cellulosilyticus (strain DSM 18568 / NBRC 106333 / KACC 11606 / 5516J-15) TaxID=1223518 RepID=A0A511N234_DEIC1|nr:class III lanthionine synthetase LanKC [Deinococcus cellulosilyticus]GEM46909.1 serine/threonine protein kinase [Deinococcus cellulosilyticus NBRC 106333 = KACC 11606]